VRAVGSDEKYVDANNAALILKRWIVIF
jgi:hypothetical protein